MFLRILVNVSFMVAIVNCKKPNVLFLVSDDMRPQINYLLGPDFPSQIHPKMHTPNLDSLCARSLVLKRAYVQQALCSPSRTSLLTGRRPDTTHVYDLKTYFRQVGGNFTTIPQYFKENGYFSIGMGKIFHPGMKASGKDDPMSWSVPYYHASRYWQNPNKSWNAVGEEERKIHPLPDEDIANHAISVLRNFSANQDHKKKPFFLAVGFHKPHLPFTFPKHYLNRYPRSSIRLPDNQYSPVNMPGVAWSDYGELRHYRDIASLNTSGQPNTTLPPHVVQQLRRAYYSALSFADEMVGKVLHELKELGLEKDTIVSFWGDHGYQLGEHDEWTKHTNFELATHAPMLIHIPGVTDDGIVTEQLTEFVDLFPTLAEAAGLPLVPRCPQHSAQVRVCSEGHSLMPLVRRPAGTDWKRRVFSQYPRKQHHDHTAIMGYSMRTTRFRYTEWVRFRGAPHYAPQWRRVVGIELYDHHRDPQENDNVYMNPEYRATVKGLSKLLHHGWRV